MDVDDRHFLWTLLENFSPFRARLGPAWPEFRAQLAENLDALEVAPDDE